MFIRLKRVRDRDYVQIVASTRTPHGPRQSVVASLGSLSDLRESGALARLRTQLAGLADESVSECQGVGFAPDGRDDLELRHRELVDDGLSRAGLKELAGAVGLPAHLEAAYHRLLWHAVAGRWQAVVLDAEVIQTLCAVAASPAANPDEGAPGPVAELIAAKVAVEHLREISLSMRRAGSHRGLPRVFEHHGLAMVTAANGVVLDVTSTPTVLPLGFIVQHKLSAARRAFGGRAAFVGDPAANLPRLIADFSSAGLPFVVALRQSCFPTASAAGVDIEFHERAAIPDDPLGDKVRRIRCIVPAAGDAEARQRALMLELVRRAALREGVGVPALARYGDRLAQADEWEGVTLLATNLDWPAPDVFRVFSASAGIREIEADYTSLLNLLLMAEVGCDVACMALTGWQTVMPAIAALRSSLAHELTGQATIGPDTRPASHCRPPIAAAHPRAVADGRWAAKDRLLEPMSQAGLGEATTDTTQ